MGIFHFFEKNKSQKDVIQDVEDVEKAPRDISEEENIYQEGLTKVLDLIAPSALGVSTNYLQVGEVYSKTFFVAAYPKSLLVGWLGPVINLDFPMDISMFIHPMDSSKVLKDLRKKVTKVQSEMEIEAEKGIVRDPTLEMAYENAEMLRDKLQEGIEKIFKFGLYFNVFGKTVDELTTNASMLESLLNARSIYAKEAIFRMKEGFFSCLPLCQDKLMNGNALNTDPLSTMFPFISADVTSNEGVLYGINRHNNSLILFDRFSMENANMVVFAKSGAGKSYAVKLEVLRSMMLGTSTVIIDPEDEYRHLSEAVGGSYIKMSLTSPNHINPFDMVKEEDKDVEEILRSNISDLLGLLKLMMGTMTPEEDSVMERAIRETYAVRDITGAMNADELASKTMPVLADLYEVLRNMKGAEDLAIRMEKYTQGIFSGFLNEPTNIKIESSLIVFNIRDLEEELRPIAMYIILHFLWNKIRTDLRKRFIVIDEAWWMMQYDESARFLYSVAKRIRKYYGGLTTITQDVSDFMASRYGKPIVSNSSIQLLLRQSQSTIDVVADTFYLTDREKYLLLESNVGEGIFFAGQKRAAIQVVASYNEDKIITTNPAQLIEMERQEKEDGSL